MIVAAIIQARMGSTRLPGKVMKLLCDKTVLSHVIERVGRCKIIDKIIIATTDKNDDDVIVKEAKKEEGVEVYRGSEENVLERYCLAAKEYKANIIIRITSDCPFVDPYLIEKMYGLFILSKDNESIDYMTNSIKRSYPHGLDVEIFTLDTLEKVNNRATRSYEKEHVTPYIYEHPDEFNIHHYDDNNNYPDFRLCLDTNEDYELIKVIYNDLYKEGNIFTSDNIIDYLINNPSLAKINAHVKQKQLGE